MNDEIKHGKKKTSTSLLLNMFANEETLPDHLLSNDSQVKKKRDSKKFFEEINFLSAIELIHLYEEIIFILQERAAEHKSQYTRNSHDQDYLITPTPAIPMRKITEDDREHLQNSKEKYLQLIANIDTKIGSVKEMIALQRQTITQLQQRANVTRNELVHEWDALLGKFKADPDFESIKISLPIAEDYQVLEIKKSAYLQVLEDINAALKKGATPTYKLYDLIREKSSALIIEQMNKDLAHLPAEFRQRLITEYKNMAVEELNQKIWLDICTTPSLYTKLEEMYKMEHAIVEAQAKLAQCEKTLDPLLDIKQKAESQLSAIDELLNGTEMHAEQILDLDSAAEKFDQQAADLDKLLSGNLSSIDALHMETDSILKELQNVKSQAMTGIKTGDLKQSDKLFSQMNDVRHQAEKLKGKYASSTEKAIVKEEKEPEDLTPRPTL